MLISPPFLVGTDEASILQAGLKNVPARESTTQAPEGNFPVSQNLMWHTGVHLEAPTKEGGGYVPVRAIADGEVIFINPARTKVDDVNHPQAYNPFGNNASWTDNGMLIIEHETEIGADGDTPTKIKFYSSYLHLSVIKHGIEQGKRVYRKDVIGEAGEIFGHAGEIEMTVACSTDELKKLIGRKPEWQDPKQIPTKDGREDSVFGNIYIYLPDNTPISVATPTSHLSSTGGSILTKAQWVEINYAKGQGRLTTYGVDGSKGNTAGVEKDFEYELYKEANTRHGSVVKAASAAATVITSSPSGWYELLRFGRNLGHGSKNTDKDPLPTNAAHWRKIKTIDGQEVWADLNAPGSFKFSEADFLPIMGWNCFGDDSNPDDQRCDSAKLKELIVDPTDPDSKSDDKKLAMRLGLPEVFSKLARTICQFPNEWDKDTIVTRYQCLKEGAEALDGGTVEGWQAFEDHLKIMAFDKLPAAFKAADWHFHPAEFIRTLRRCAWLSEAELAQTVALSKRTPDIESVSSLFSTELKDKGGRVMRPSLVYPSISFTMRKYGINTSLRMAHWFGQILQETGTFAYMRELGDTAYFTNYYEDRCKTPVTRKIKGKDMTLSPLGNCDPGDGSRFSGKGLIQLTGGDNYRNYQAYRGAGNFTVDPGPETLITNAFNACDAGGYYWSSKQRMQKINGKLVPLGSLGINYWTEKDAFSNLSNLTAVDAAVHDVTKNVNPGLDGLDHRQTFFKHAFSYLSDMTDHFPAEFKPLHHQEKK